MNRKFLFGIFSAFLATCFLKIYFYSGYILGDDYIFAWNLIHYLRTGVLDWNDQMTYRTLWLVPQAFLTKILGQNNFTFGFQIFLYSCALQGLAIKIAWDLWSPKRALIVALLFLASPFEILSSSTMSPDYPLAFYLFLSAYLIYLAHQKNMLSLFILAGLSTIAASLFKLSALYICPLVGLGFLLAASHPKPKRFYLHWASYFLTVLIGFTIPFFISLWKLGAATKWFQLAFPFQGHPLKTWVEVQNALLSYPRLLFWTEPEYGFWMFGLVGWVFALGAGWLFWELMTKKESRTTPQVFLVLSFIFILMNEFIPHKIAFDAYYSHPRIFRYLAMMTPAIYFIAAHFFDAPLRKYVRGTILGGVVVFGIWQIPKVTFPSVDAVKDQVALDQYLQKNPPPPHSIIHADWWINSRIRSLQAPQSLDWKFNDFRTNSPEEKLKFLSEIESGLVITGGGTLPWYSGKSWMLNLKESQFHPPPHWTLLSEFPMEPQPWRKEPLQVWEVKKLE